jgi:hypothetical protein
MITAASTANRENIPYRNNSHVEVSFNSHTKSVRGEMVNSYVRMSHYDQERAASSTSNSTPTSDDSMLTIIPVFPEEFKTPRSRRSHNFDSLYSPKTHSQPPHSSPLRFKYRQLSRSMCELQSSTDAEFQLDEDDLISRTQPCPLSSSNMHPRSPGHMLQHLRVYGRKNGEVEKRFFSRNAPLDKSSIQEAPIVEMKTPLLSTIWTRGRPAPIEWEVLDDQVERVEIELMEEGSNATTLIAPSAPNTGFFIYAKVPWGMACGNRYYLRISSTSDSSKYMTTPFFQISSA